MRSSSQPVYVVATWVVATWIANLLGMYWTGCSCTWAQAESSPDPPASVENTSAPGGDWDPQELVAQLASDKFSAREMAFWRLQKLGYQALPTLEAKLGSADANLSERLIRLISEIASEPEKKQGWQAYETLERIADGSFSRRAMFAKHALRGIAEHQRELAELQLVQMGAIIAADPNLQILTSARRDGRVILRLNQSYRGPDELLDRLRWVSGIDTVVLEGPGVNRAWLVAVTTMPDLRVLQIRRASLSDADIAVLGSLNQLEILEFIYVPLRDSSIEVLTALPVMATMRVFGTSISIPGFDRLVAKKSDIEILYGKGGTLGVSIANPANGVMIQAVTDGGAAQRYGLRAGDKLLAVNDKMLAVFEDLRRELANYAAGERVMVTLERPGPMRPGQPRTESSKLELGIVLGEQP